MVTHHQFHQLVQESTMERMVELPIKEEEDGEKEDVVIGLGTQHYFQELVTIFPDVCPEYLYTRLSAIVEEERLDREKTSQFNNLVEELLGVENLPTRREWLARRRNQEEVTEYTEQMTAEQFLDLYPDPAAYFSNTNRPLIKDQEYRDHAMYDLLLRFPFQNKNKVVQAFNRSGKLYIPAVNDLSRQLNTRISRRINDRNAGLPRLRTPHCKELLKEKKFLELKDQIEWLITSRKKERKALLARARDMGELYQCCCCYGDEMLQDEMVVCEAEIGHLHCQECVTNNVRNVLGEGKMTVFCCQPDCVQEIGCKNLSQILEPVLWSKYLEKKTELEVRSAGLDGLVNCPFCPFAAVLEDEDRVFMCRNSECGINSCRLCHRPNHIPLTCEELNQKADTARQEMEESMTNALLRQCWRCHRRFYKEEGCNRVTCTHCNAKTCYICGAQDLDGYNHFYGEGGVRTETKTCPLWSNTKEMHRVAVAEAEREGKAKLDKFRNI